MGWYLSSNLEKALSAFQQNTESIGENDFKVELLSYRRTILGSKAKFQINFNYPVLGGLLDKIEINAKVINGPVFIHKSGIGIGKAHWSLQIDESSLDLDMLENLKLLFPDKLPLLNATFDFKDNVHYHSTVRLPVALLHLTGFYDTTIDDNRTAISLEKLRLGDDKISLETEKALVSIQHHKTNTKTYIPEKISASIPDLKINSYLFKHPVILKLKANSHIYSKNKQLNGFHKIFLKKEINKNSPVEVPINSADLALYFNNISNSLLFDLAEINAEISNLRQQVSWILEEKSEYPEGQDQIWQINDQLESLSAQRSKILVNTLDKKDTQLHLEAKFKDASGISHLKGVLKPSIKKQNRTSFFSLFRGEVDVNLTADLYNYLNTLLALKKKQFKLVFEDNKLLIYQ